MSDMRRIYYVHYMSDIRNAWVGPYDKPDAISRAKSWRMKARGNKAEVQTVDEKNAEQSRGPHY